MFLIAFLATFTSPQIKPHWRGIMSSALMEQAMRVIIGCFFDYEKARHSCFLSFLFLLPLNHYDRNSSVSPQRQQIWTMEYMRLRRSLSSFLCCCSPHILTPHRCSTRPFASRSTNLSLQSSRKWLKPTSHSRPLSCLRVP